MHLLTKVKERLDQIVVKRAVLYGVLSVSYGFLTYSVFSYFGASLNGLIVALIIFFIGSLLFKRSVKYFRATDFDAARYIDSKFALKERATSLIELEGIENAEKANLIEKQIENSLIDITEEDFPKLSLSKFFKILLFSLPIVWMVAFICLIYKPADIRFLAKEKIELVLLREADLPAPIKEALESFLDTISKNDIASEEVLSALLKAEEEIERAKAELAKEKEDIKERVVKEEDQKEPEEKEGKETDKDDSGKAQREEEGDKGEKKPDSEDGGEQGDGKGEKEKGSEGSKEGSDSAEQGSKGGEGEGESESEETGDKGDGKEGSKEDSKQGDDSGEQEGGEKEGAGDDNDGDKQTEKEDSTAQAITAASKAIDEIKEEIDRSKEDPSKGSGSGKMNDTVKEEKPDPLDSKKDGETDSPDRESPRSEREKEADQDSDSENETGIPDQSSFSEAGEAKEFVGKEGGEEEGDIKREIDETFIESDDDALDTRFTGQERELSLNKEEARAKTPLDNIKMAKPESVAEKDAQPIPLEYKDLLQ